MFWCPGCDGAHQVNVFEVENRQGPLWSYNGNPDAPTFSPSILVQGHMHGRPIVCHSFVTDGRVRFLTDCSHSLAGQTVDLPDFEDA